MIVSRSSLLVDKIVITAYLHVADAHVHNFVQPAQFFYTTSCLNAHAHLLVAQRNLIYCFSVL